MRKATKNKRKLLEMDLRYSFPSTLQAHVRFFVLDKLETLTFHVPKNKDLLSFIYSLINPFHQPDGWLINGDNYHSTFFYLDGSDVISLSSINFVASHTMQKGIILRSKTDKKANQFFGT